MGQFTQDGVIYEEMPDGQVKVVGYAGAPAAGQVFNLAPSPEKARAEGRADEAANRARAADERAAAAAERAEREWNATHNPDGSPKKTAGGAKQLPDNAAKRYEDAINAYASLDRAVAGWKDDFGGNTWTGGLENTLQSKFGTGTPGQAQWWSDFAATDNVLRNALYGASLTAGEKAAYEATSIKPSMEPDQIRANLERRRSLAQGVLARRTNFLKANGYNPEAIDALAGEYIDVVNGKAQQHADNEVPQANGADTKPPATNDSPPDLPPANAFDNPPETAGAIAETADGKRTTFDAQTSSQIDAMINAGASKSMLDAVLKKKGYPTINAGDLAAAKLWMKNNPGKRYYGAQINRTDDLSLWQRAVSNPLGAAAAQYADAATAGTVGALAGDEGRASLDAMAALHPNASAVGALTGGVTGAMGTEAMLAAKAPSALARFAPAATDTLYGAAYGFNTAEDGEGGMGALQGGGAGLGGGILGRTLFRGVGKAARGVVNPDIVRLQDAGVPLTVGQTLGGQFKGFEDRLTGTPFVEGAVNARRREGIEAAADYLNNRALAPIGGSTSGYGDATINDMLTQGSDAYTLATAGAHVPLDPQFATDMGVVRASSGLLPDDLASRFDRAINNRILPIENAGELTGDSFQQAVRGLKGYRAETPKPGFEQDYRDSLSLGIDALRDQMNRGGGQQVVDDLAKADQAWRGIKIAQKATTAAKNGARSGEVGLPMPSQYNDAAAAAAAKYGGPRFEGDFLDSAQRVLPSKVGDSGTAGRLLQQTLLGGGGVTLGAGVGGSEGGVPGAVSGGAGGALGTVLLLAAGGSKPAQKLLVQTLTRRPDALRRFGEGAIENQRIGGWTGAGVLTPLLVGQ